MATDKRDLTYLPDHLSGPEGLTDRSMMGEYLLYLNGKMASYLCGGAKPALWVEDVDGRAFLIDLF